MFKIWYLSILHDASTIEVETIEGAQTFAQAIKDFCNNSGYTEENIIKVIRLD